MPKILAFAGSSREKSLNKKLLAIAVEGARSAGAEVTHIDLADYPMPLFDTELEAREGTPESALKVKQLMVEHQGFLIASPEYNSAFSALLKNTIDWASRTQSKDEPPMWAFKGKYAAIMSASPGALGGLRGLVFLRMLLGNLGVTVLPEQQAIVRASTAFADNGSLVDHNQQQSVLGLGEKLHQLLSKVTEA